MYGGNEERLPTVCNISHLPKRCPSLFKAAHLHSLFEQVERVSEGFANGSSTTATHQVFNIPYKAKKLGREEYVVSEFTITSQNG